MDKSCHLHSQAYFTDHREFWWNSDFLELMAARWDVTRVTSVLDVGCGQGHWGRALLPVLPRAARVVGIDPESRWVDVARQRAADSHLSQRLTYQLGTAERLPFDDATFDMVTCQTVLIHLNDPLVGLREMLRVVKPGGLIVVAEPNNAVPAMVLDPVKQSMTVDDRLSIIRLQFISELGKSRLGEGNNMRGDLVPHYVHSIGLEAIRVHLSDMADFYIPPYESARERAGVAKMRADFASGSFLWSETETKRYFEAGGGNASEFDRLWNVLRVYNETLIAHLNANQLCLPGGTLFYLVSARRPLLVGTHHA